MNLIVDIWRAVQSQWLLTLWYVFQAFSVQFTIVKAIEKFNESVKISGPIPLSVMVCLSAVYAVWKVFKPSCIEIRVANCNTTIVVLFGDIFSMDGIRAIAVSEFFESELGKPVSKNSVHGMFLQKCFGGHPEAFDKQINKELANVEYDTVTKAIGKNKRYPIGTTAVISANNDVYMAFANSRTNPSTLKVSADVTDLWTSLHGLWQGARNECGGDPLNLPLVGTGLSGVGLPTRDVLNLIILSVITETKAREITQTIRIVLHNSRRKDIDLGEVRKHWKE